MEGARTEEAVEPQPESSTADPRDLISSDDEIDYSIKPEFYDPNIDNRDELWVHKQRKGRSTDAVLSCPACFTTLCLDCQRHERYVTQYRAMFVTNCNVSRDQILRQPKQKPRKSRHHVDSGKPQENADKDEVFHPVCCSVCATEDTSVIDSFGRSQISQEKRLYNALWVLKQPFLCNLPLPDIAQD